MRHNPQLPPSECDQFFIWSSQGTWRGHSILGRSIAQELVAVSVWQGKVPGREDQNCFNLRNKLRAFAWRRMPAGEGWGLKIANKRVHRGGLLAQQCFAHTFLKDGWGLSASRQRVVASRSDDGYRRWAPQSQKRRQCRPRSWGRLFSEPSASC